MKNVYLEKALEIKEEVILLRRTIHRNPELSFKEYETSKYIRNFLDSYGIENKPIAGTGVTALIGSGGKCAALRADIDALPVTEQTGLEFASKNKGVMHACGHDMHASMLLGAAKILKGMEDELGGTVKLIFQPGEEKLPGGASLLIKEGILENPKPQAVFGQHINPKLTLGKIAFDTGPVMGSADELYWEISGFGSHAAQPHYGNDTILAASQIVTTIQTLVTKYRDPIVPGVISVTSLQGGTAPNIFPESVKMMGTMRTFDSEWRVDMHKKIKNISDNICEIYGCKCDLNIVKGYPPLINNDETTRFLKKTAENIFGIENVLPWKPIMWAEDFAYYAQEVPSTFWFLGASLPEKTEDAPGLHNPKLNPEEDAMVFGTALMAGAAAEFFK